MKHATLHTLLWALLLLGGVAAADAADWALARVSVACVREEPRHSAELGSQIVMGTPVKVDGDLTGNWLKITTPEGYHGYIIANSLTLLPGGDEGLTKWQNQPRVVVTSADQDWVYSLPESDPQQRVSDVVNGSVLIRLPDDENGYAKVMLPDGRSGFIEEAHIISIDSLAVTTPDAAAITDFAHTMMGVPYLWGGTSTKSADCSGFSKICYFTQGIVLPRNASQQAKVGTSLDISDVDAFRPGDLLFFGNASTGHVNHVGIALGDGLVIHSSGMVKVNSLKRVDKVPYIGQSLLAARRIIPATDPSLSLAENPYYFKKTK